jgi:dihydrolipoamide dehydrogenase
LLAGVPTAVRALHQEGSIMRKIEVAIVGAGSAAIAARAEVARVTDDYLVVDDGPLGTTCARVGCMPSKAFIQVANDFHRRHAAAAMGIRGADRLEIDRAAAMAHVRRLRDAFVSAVLRDMQSWRDRVIAGRARLIDGNALAVGDERIEARRIVLATGSSPVVPEAWRPYGAHLIDTDRFFDVETLPDRMAVLGLGAIGVELGQALARLGIDVTGVSLNRALGGLTAPKLQDVAVSLLAKEMPLRFGAAEIVGASDHGLTIAVGGERVEAGKALVALGRRPNLAGLGLQGLGLALDARGLPPLEPETLRITGTDIYLAGDATGGRATLHEAVDEGRMAGYNAVRPDDQYFRRRVRLAITFADPNIAVVGKSWKELSEQDRPFVVGEASFARQGRAVVMREADGRIEVYADRESGRLLGAELMAPRGEHLAHLVALALSAGMTLGGALSLPFYHPSIEEGLRTALKDAAYKLEERTRDVELMRCAEPPAGATI